MFPNMPQMQNACTLPTNLRNFASRRQSLCFTNRSDIKKKLKSIEAVNITNLLGNGIVENRKSRQKDESLGFHKIYAWIIW
ncbi:hypothetical protein ACH3XW_44475 [Acanthocheilonema viteae]